MARHLQIGAMALLTLGFLLPSIPAAADSSWKEKTVITLTVGATVETLSESEQSVSLKENVARIDDLKSGVARIVNFQTRQEIILNFGAKTFALLSVSEMMQMDKENREQIKADLPAREAGLSSVPESERAKVAAQIEAQKKRFQAWEGGYLVTPTDRVETIDGYTCKLYQGLSKGEVFQELWVAENIQMGDDYGRFYKKGMAELEPYDSAYLMHLPSPPIKTVTHYGAVTVTKTVSRVLTEKFPIDALLIPEDFKPAQTIR